LLFGALLVGATSAGITRAMRGERSRRPRVTLSQLARCLGGGALMGWASLMIPGGNDSLVLVAMPLLRPYAWVAFAAMCVAIGAVSLSRSVLRARWHRETRELA
jgi:toxin CptA